MSKIGNAFLNAVLVSVMIDIVLILNVAFRWPVAAILEAIDKVDPRIIQDIILPPFFAATIIALVFVIPIEMIAATVRHLKEEYDKPSSSLVTGLLVSLVAAMIAALFENYYSLPPIMLSSLVVTFALYLFFSAIGLEDSDEESIDESVEEPIIGGHATSLVLQIAGVFALVFLVPLFDLLLMVRSDIAINLGLSILASITIIIAVANLFGFLAVCSIESLLNISISLSKRGILGVICASLIVRETLWAVLPDLGLMPLIMILMWGLTEILIRLVPNQFGERAFQPPEGRLGWIVHAARKGLGSAKILLVTILLVSSFTVVAVSIVTSQSATAPLSSVRVAVIDVGMFEGDPILGPHIVAQKSFISYEFNYIHEEPDPSSSGVEVSHASIVAHCILEEFSQAQLINARVFDSIGNVTTEGIIGAIDWCVRVANASVINLSLGSPLWDLNNTRVQDKIQWAWNLGVLPVVSAGNAGQGPLGSINRIASTGYCIAVAALDGSELVAGYSSRGPVREGLVKPDISAVGFFRGNEERRGTSYAAPRVAGAAAHLIDELQDRGLRWTPGLVKAALMAGADSLPLPNYVAGAGRLDFTETLGVVLESPIISELPQVAYVSLNPIPLDFLHIFAGVNYTERLGFYCSDELVFDVNVTDSLSGIVSCTSGKFNQCGVIEVKMAPPESTESIVYEGELVVTSTILNTSVRVEFEARPPIAKLGIDTGHDTVNTHALFGAYNAYYNDLAEYGIAPIELRAGELTDDKLSVLDGLVLLDPFTSMNPEYQANLTSQEYNTLRSYIESGHPVVLVTGSGNSTTVNEMFNWTGVEIGNESKFLWECNMTSHPITEDQDCPWGQVRVLNHTGNFTTLVSVPDWGSVLLVSEVPYRLVITGGALWFRDGLFQSELPIRMTLWALEMLTLPMEVSSTSAKENDDDQLKREFNILCGATCKMPGKSYELGISMLIRPLPTLEQMDALGTTITHGCQPDISWHLLRQCFRVYLRNKVCEALK